MSSCSSTRMVEYLEPLMSKELLCKFPDNSAFDFDYTQSSIWSPLVPRSYTTPMDSEFDLDLDFFTPKKLKFEIGLESSNLNNKVASKSKNKFKMNLSALKRKKSKNKRKMAPSDFSPTSIQVTCNLAATKVLSFIFFFFSGFLGSCFVSLFDFPFRMNNCSLYSERKKK